MPSASQAAIPVTAAWIDLVAANAALNAVDVDLQFEGRCEAAVAEYRLGGAAPGVGIVGRKLPDGQSVSVNSDAIWVRATLGGQIHPIVI